MSDLITLVLMIATTALGFISISVLSRVAYKRTDDILSGLVNGVSVSLTSRWLLFLHDYLGQAFGGTLLLFIFAVGWLGASEVVSEPNAKNLAYLLAGASAWGFLFNLLLSLLWIRHFVSVLRQAEAD